jgi:hypothetical protein
MNLGPNGIFEIVRTKSRAASTCLRQPPTLAESNRCRAGKFKHNGDFTMSSEMKDDEALAYDPLIDTIVQVLGDYCGINIDDNCGLDEFGDLLTEINGHFSGDTNAALAAIFAKDLQFEEVRCHDTKHEWLEWHIAATKQ